VLSRHCVCNVTVVKYVSLQHRDTVAGILMSISLCSSDVSESLCVCSIGASLHIYRTSLESLDLRSLMSIRNGGVLIKSNPRLCYVDNMHWELIQSSAEQKLLVAGNANASQCGVCLSMIDC